MKGRQLLQVITGQAADDVAALTAEIEAEKAKASEACAKLEWLELEPKTADTFQAARALDEQITQARWTIERADTVIPHLEGRLSVARAEKQAAGIIRHHKAAERAYRKLRVAIDAAAAAQVEAITARDELGEGLVQVEIPAVAFRGNAHAGPGGDLGDGTRQGLFRPAAEAGSGATPGARLRRRKAC